MTETAWLACSDPQVMLAFLRDRGASDRKLRLFACAVCRRLGYRVGRGGLDAVAAAERFADGRTDDYDLVIAAEVLESRLRPVDSHRDLYTHLLQRLPEICLLTDIGDRQGLSLIAAVAGPAGGADLLREVFGNPFLPVGFDPGWRTEAAVALARQLYESGEFGAMPILGDALQDAGCETNDILAHCHGPGPHARGCWVADMVLGRS